MEVDNFTLIDSSCTLDTRDFNGNCALFELGFYNSMETMAQLEQ